MPGIALTTTLAGRGMFSMRVPLFMIVGTKPSYVLSRAFYAAGAGTHLPTQPLLSKIENLCFLIFGLAKSKNSPAKYFIAAQRR